MDQSDLPHVVGPAYTEEVLAAVGVKRVTASEQTEEHLLQHYVGDSTVALYARFGDKLLMSVLPAARLTQIDKSP
eukprot:3296509-Amphidinium_carterae.1